MKEGVRNMKRKSWINFARYSSPPIGKGKIIECKLDNEEGELLIDMTLDGVQFVGKIYDVAKILAKQEEE
tara:strand:- start:1292 stop:1501 length:210 start_codon:yes stop_codon:yes gene_type:complete